MIAGIPEFFDNLTEGQTTALIVTAMVLALMLSLVCRLITFKIDRHRIRGYLRKRGSELHRARWSPFGPGWFGERNARIYKIQYTDSEERLHFAFAKTSLFSGVYLTRDTVIG